MVSGAIALAWLGISVACIVVGTSRFKLHPLPLMLLAALGYGLATGQSPATTIAALRSGFGVALSNVGLIVIIGFFLERMLARAGLYASLADMLSRRVQKRGLPFLALAAGWVAGIGVPAETGLVTLAPAARALDRNAGLDSLPLATGIYASHALLLPTAIPIAAAIGFRAGLGRMFLLGIPASIAAAAAGFWWISRFALDLPDIASPSADHPARPRGGKRHMALALAGLAFPFVAIPLAAIAALPSRPFGSGFLYSASIVAGEPIVAILIALFLVSVTAPDLLRRDDFAKSARSDLVRLLETMLTLGAGGAYAQVLKVGPLANLANTLPWISGLGILAPFILAALVRFGTGSPLIAVIAASGALMSQDALGGVDAALAALAACSGAMVFPHVNDSWFWLVSAKSDVRGLDAVRKISVTMTIQGVAAFLVIAILHLSGI